MKIIYFEWADAVASVGWEEIKTHHKIHKCKAIGFLIEETKEELTIASTISGDQCNARMTIPKSWIKRKKEIKI
jgi:hypothetical protein